jgi:hypothetical protein
MNLREIDLMEPAIEWRNALGFDDRETGRGPRRLPDWTRPQIPDLFVEAMVRMTSGVRLAFRTNATRVELDVGLLSFRGVDDPPRTLGFDVVVDGEVLIRESTDGGSRFVLDPITREVLGFEEGAPIMLGFDLDGASHDVEIWLPTAASCDIQALRISSGAAVERAAPTGRRHWVHHGSSISHCMEVVHPTETWPAVAARAGAVDLTNLALAGQCHLDQYVARTMRDLAPDLVSLKVGINVINMDSMKERIFKPAFHGFVDTIRERNPDTPFVVVSPIFCPSAEDHPGPTVTGRDGRFRVIDGPAALRDGSLTLRRVREILSEAVAQRRAAGDAHLHYLDGLTLFAEADHLAGDLPDDLHPSPAGYRRMGERFAAAMFGAGAPFATPA